MVHFAKWKTWLTLAIKENRAIGHAQPGFEVVTTVRMVIAPVPPVVELSDKALAGLPLEPGAGETLVEFRSDDGGFQLRHDRRWNVMLERPIRPTRTPTSISSSKWIGDL